MSDKDTREVCCDLDKHIIPDGQPFFHLTGGYQVAADGQRTDWPQAPGSVSGDFCCMAHATAYASALPEFNKTPV